MPGLAEPALFVNPHACPRASGKSTGSSLPPPETGARLCPGLATRRNLPLRLLLAPLMRVQRLVGSRQQFLDRAGARRVETDHANAEGQGIATVRLGVALA